MKTQSSLLLIAAPLGVQAFTAPKASSNRFAQTHKIAAVPEIVASVTQADITAVQSQASSAVGDVDLGSIQSQVGSALDQVDFSPLKEITSSVGEVTAALKTKFPILADVPVAGVAIGLGAFAVGSVVGGGGDEIKLKGLEGEIDKKNKEIARIRDSLDNSQSETSGEEAEMEEKIVQLQKQIVDMDAEFEEQSGVMMKEFEDRVQGEIQKREDKIKEDAKYSFEIKAVKERQKMENEKAEISKVASKNEAAMEKMMIELEENEASRDVLQGSLTEAEEEIEKLRALSEDKGFSLFDGVKVQIENGKMEKEVKTIKASLDATNMELEGALAEIEEIKFNNSIWGFLASMGIEIPKFDQVFDQVKEENVEEQVEKKNSAPIGINLPKFDKVKEEKVEEPVEVQ